LLRLQAEVIGDTRLLVARLDGVDATSLQQAALKLGERLGDASAVVLGAVPAEGKVSIVAAFGAQLVQQRGLHAGKLVGGVAKLCGGGGGGKPALAQAGGRRVDALPDALAQAEAQLREALSA
jgi:alanyl-tRNA synthetase